jgi:hypothetical protein
MGRNLGDGIDFIRYSTAYIILLFAGTGGGFLAKLLSPRSEMPVCCTPGDNIAFILLFLLKERR